jgi:hypothetical protein
MVSWGISGGNFCRTSRKNCGKFYCRRRSSYTAPNGNSDSYGDRDLNQHADPHPVAYQHPGPYSNASPHQYAQRSADDNTHPDSLHTADPHQFAHAMANIDPYANSATQPNPIADFRVN